MWSQNSWEKNLFLLNRLPVPPPTWWRGTSSFFSTCWKNLHVRHRTLPSWGSQDRDSSKISTLSFSIKSMLENRESLFFIESRQYIRPAPWNRVKMALKSIPMYKKGPSRRRIKWYISDNSLLYPRCHACSIEPSLVDNLLLKMQPLSVVDNKTM